MTRSPTVLLGSDYAGRVERSVRLLRGAPEHSGTRVAESVLQRRLREPRRLRREERGAGPARDPRVQARCEVPTQRTLAGRARAVDVDSDQEAMVSRRRRPGAPDRVDVMGYGDESAASSLSSTGAYCTVSDVASITATSAEVGANTPAWPTACEVAW